jgi:hypothetical protein
MTCNMKKQPTLYTLEGLLRTAGGDVQSSNDGKIWVPARPVGFHSIANRLRCTWAVFTGRADAVIWPQGQ